MQRVVDSQDILLAIFVRVKDPGSIFKLAAVSKQCRVAAQSDPVWCSAILAFFGEKILNVVLESIENHDLRARYPFTTHNQAQEEGVSHSTQQPWTLRSAFQAIVVAVSKSFQESPEDAIGAITHDLSVNEAGAVAASYICWCSQRRRGLPDIRTQATRGRAQGLRRHVRHARRAARRRAAPLPRPHRHAL